MQRFISVCCLSFLAVGGPFLATAQAPSPLLGAMDAELQRSMLQLKSQPVSPYFLSYEIVETHAFFIESSFGQLEHSSENHNRVLSVDLRVGDYALDSSREIRGGMRGFSFPSYSYASLPVDNDPDAVRAALWQQTDQSFKHAVEQYTKVKTNVQVAVASEDKSDDFSHENAQHYSEPQVDVALDRHAWEEKMRRYTAPFATHKDIYGAQAILQVNAETRWFVNSDGARLQTSQPAWRLFLVAYTKADDGMELPRYESFLGFSEKDLPGDDVVNAKVGKMITDLEALRVAPLADPYTGPAILSGRASGVFFHEIFGHRVGVLKTFLMSRTPIEGVPQSNGHGRGSPGRSPVARQSNLIVEVGPAAVKPDLKKLLIEEVQKKSLPYGLYFEDISGGFTFTGRITPNAFNVLPLMVYRIYPDGREQLVRGVDLIGTPLTTFSKIEAAGNQPAVFNGICGAESGGVPVSAVSPAILISQIEVQKKQKSQSRAPILPAPF